MNRRPSATTYELEDLVNSAWQGQVRVPHFQRDFRWALEDVRKLFDSIIKGYPIGSLLLWTRKAPAQTLQLGALTIDAKEASEGLWVVDGQQRLTSIANALHPTGHADPRFSLSYDLDRGEFVRTPSHGERAEIIPLPVIFNLQEILRWFARHPELGDRLDEATSVTTRLRQFQIPAYLVSGDEPSVLQDIFDRMNNYGKRLSRAEIFSALNAGDELKADESLTFERIAEHVDSELRFGRIDNDTVLASVLARRGPEIRRDIRNEFSNESDEGRDAAYLAGEEALRRAVTFLQVEAGVPHISMLAYRYLLVVLTRFFAFFPEPGGRNLRLLRRWYWQAAVAGPEVFRGGTPNAARVLCGQIVEPQGGEVDAISSSVQRLLGAVAYAQRKLPDLARFATNEAGTKIVLCAWWAEAPRDPETGEPFDRAGLAEALLDQRTARDSVRYVLPRAAVPVEYRKWAANRLLLPDLERDPDEVLERLSRQPTEWDEARWFATLKSHSITPGLAADLATGNASSFVQVRQELLERNLSLFLERMCEWRFEDTPPLSSFIFDDDDTDGESGDHDG